MINFEKTLNITQKIKQSFSTTSPKKQQSSTSRKKSYNNLRSVLNNSHKPPNIYTNDIWYEKIKVFMGFNSNSFYNTEDTIS
jgi:hypothetical protein